MLRLYALGTLLTLALSAQATETASFDSASAAAVFEIDAPAGVGTAIDAIVFQRLDELRLTPGLRCSDQVFIRRAFIDVIGTLPRADEVRRFLSNRDAGKRAKLIDHLLGREEFTDYWTMKGSALLRIKAEFPVNLWPNAAQGHEFNGEIALALPSARPRNARSGFPSDWSRNPV